ncbi:hypothetical protein JCM10213_004395 [Rhodosporidiobolus nylandii]
MRLSLFPHLSLFSLSALAAALPAPMPPSPTLLSRQYVAGVSVPYFPGDIPSCAACEPDWSSINSCAQAAPAFQMIYNPLSFVSAIKCACTDTFNSAYPRCVDCFVQTNQCEEFLGVPSEQNASSILDGIRSVCGLGSALLGGVATSQAKAGVSYTYNGVPDQGYPTSTSIGPGGIDYGSAEGASGAASQRDVGVTAVVALAGVVAALVWV